jgi:hypothetical protein
MGGRWLVFSVVCGVGACGPAISVVDEDVDGSDVGGEVSTGAGDDDPSSSEDSDASTGTLPDPGTTGALRWFRVLDGGGDDFGHDVDLAGDGSVHVAGVRGDRADGMLPFVAVLDRDGELQWDFDIDFGNPFVAGLSAESLTLARVIVYGEDRPFFVGASEDSIEEFSPVGSSAPVAIGWATVGRLDAGGFVVGGRTSEGTPWLERRDTPTTLSWWSPLQHIDQGEVWFLAPIDDDMLALVSDYDRATQRLFRLDAAGNIEWSLEIPCMGTIGASSLGITIPNGPDGELCRITPDGALAPDPFGIHLERPVGALGMAADGDLIAMSWSSEDEARVYVTRVDVERGLEWTADVTGPSDYVLPFSIVVAPDGSSATSGVLAIDEHYDAFVFALDP